VNWNKAIYDDCWAERRPGRVTVRLPEPAAETSAHCGREIRSGIWVRDHPDRLPYPRPVRES
jgi:hypothetical protein